MQGKCAAGQNATDNKSKIEKKFQSFLGSVRLVMSVINNVRQLLWQIWYLTFGDFLKINQQGSVALVHMGTLKCNEQK